MQRINKAKTQVQILKNHCHCHYHHHRRVAILRPHIHTTSLPSGCELRSANHALMHGCTQIDTGIYAGTHINGTLTNIHTVPFYSVPLDPDALYLHIVKFLLWYACDHTFPISTSYKLCLIKYSTNLDLHILILALYL